MAVVPERRHTGQSACVSGSSGFLGTHLKLRLESAGIKVHSLPRDFLYRGDLLKRFFRTYPPDFIFHLAAYGNMSHQQETQRIFDANVLATFNMLEASKTIPYKAFINVSSSSAGLPTQTMYAATKLAGESIAKAFVQTYDLPIATVRPFSVYGPAEAEFRFIPTVINCLLTGKTLSLDPYPVHDWIYSDDLISGMLAVSNEINSCKGLVMDLGTGIQHSNADVVSMLEEIAGQKVKVNITEQRLRTFDNTEWKAKVGIGSARPLKEGLRLVYEYYKQRFEATDNRN